MQVTPEISYYRELSKTLFETLKQVILLMRNDPTQIKSNQGRLSQVFARFVEPLTQILKDKQSETYNQNNTADEITLFNQDLDEVLSYFIEVAGVDF